MKVEVEQAGTLETTIDGAMTVDHVLPHHSKRATHHMISDSGIDMDVGRVPPQSTENHADYIDVDLMDGTSGTPLMMKDGSLPSNKQSSLVHGWSPSQGSDENGISTTTPTNNLSLKAAANLGKYTETGPEWNSTVPDATNSKDYRPSENNIASRNVTPSTSFNSTKFHSATSDHDTGHISLMTAHSMINDSDSHKPPESALLLQENSNLQPLPNTISSAPFAVLPSPKASAVIVNDNLHPASSEGQTILAVKNISILWLLIVDVIVAGHHYV